MRASRIVILGLILLAFAGVGVWLLQKPGVIQDQGPAPINADVPSTPSSPTPISNSSSSSAPTASPESETIIGLDARSLAVCHGELLKKKGIESLMDCERSPVDDQTAQSYCRSYQAELSQRLQRATASSASCPQELATATNYYKSMRALAARGDIPAQRCFIQGYFGTASKEDPDSWITDEQQKDYIVETRKFIDAAFERGDWSVVRWLGRTRTELADGLLLQAYPIGIDHLDTLYRMKYLLLLGKQPDVSKTEDTRRLVDFWKQNKKLAPEEIAEAESQAHQMFDQHFNGSQEGASITGANFCELR